MHKSSLKLERGTFVHSKVWLPMTSGESWRERELTGEKEWAEVAHGRMGAGFI